MNCIKNEHIKKIMYKNERIKNEIIKNERIKNELIKKRTDPFILSLPYTLFILSLPYHLHSFPTLPSSFFPYPTIFILSLPYHLHSFPTLPFCLYYPFPFFTSLSIIFFNPSSIIYLSLHSWPFLPFFPYLPLFLN